PGIAGGGVRRRQGHRQQSVRAQLALGIGAVHLDQASVEPRLIARIASQESLLEHAVGVLDGLLNAFAAEARLVAIAQLHGLARSCRSARGDGGTPQRARIEQHIGFDRGVTAGIDDLARADVGDSAHGVGVLNKISSSGRALTASSSSFSVFRSGSIRSRGHALGPSESALDGSGWVSMNIPAIPEATAARASTGMNSRWPPEAVPLPPGSCTEWVAS